MKRLGILLLTALIGIGLAQEDTLRVLLSSELTTLDPQITTDTDSAAVRYQIYNGLLKMTESGEAVPDLAESWEISEDGTQYTFQLRPGVTFHDGAPLNAQAVKASFERLLAEDRDTSASAYFKPIVESVEVVDDLTVRFTLNEPFAPFLNTLAHPAGHIVSPLAIEQYGEELGMHPVGTGPYQFSEWVRGERLVLERFDDYFEGPAPMAAIEYRIIPEAATRVALLETDEADIILRVTPDEAKRLAQNPEIKLETTPTARAMFMAINMTREPFDDKRVRQAINHAVNVREIITALFGEEVPQLDSPLAPGVFGYNPTRTYEFDPERARELLAEAGYEAGDISIDLWSPSGRYVQDATVAQAVAQQLEAFGFDVNLRLFGDFSEYIEVAFVEDRGDMMLLGWSPSTLEAEGGLYQILHGDHANKFANNSGFDNPEFNRLIEEARSMTSEEDRLAAYAQAQEIVMEEAPWLFLYPQPVITAMRANVHDVVILPSEHLVLREAWKE
ncbi:MAG TPA: glutathione ABC transporter substrate-binding protein [Trueperaceae bacterium]